MSLELVKQLAKITFVIPLSQGGGTFRKGQTIVGKGVKPRIIYIVYEGVIRKCSLSPKFQEKLTQGEIKLKEDEGEKIETFENSYAEDEPSVGDYSYDEKAQS